MKPIKPRSALKKGDLVVRRSDWKPARQFRVTERDHVKLAKKFGDELRIQLFNDPGTWHPAAEYVKIRYMCDDCLTQANVYMYHSGGGDCSQCGKKEPYAGGWVTEEDERIVDLKIGQDDTGDFWRPALIERNWADVPGIACPHCAYDCVQRFKAGTDARKEGIVYQCGNGHNLVLYPKNAGLHGGSFGFKDGGYTIGFGAKGFNVLTTEQYLLWKRVNAVVLYPGETATLEGVKYLLLNEPDQLQLLNATDSRLLPTVLYGNRMPRGQGASVPMLRLMLRKTFEELPDFTSRKDLGLGPP